LTDLEKYLLPTEIPVVVVRRHWAFLARDALIFGGFQLAAFFVLAFMSREELFAWVGTLILFGSLAWFGWVFCDWWVERFVVTDKRVLLATGILTKRVAIMPLTKVTDMTYERSILGRIFGYGVFVMESAGQDQALSRIAYLPSPDRVYQDVSMLLFGPRLGSEAPVRFGPAPRPGSGAGPDVHPTSPLPPLR